jgi:hypothetical protein
MPTQHAPPVEKDDLQGVRRPPDTGQDLPHQAKKVSRQRHMHKMRKGSPISLLKPHHLARSRWARLFLRIRFFFHFHLMRPFFFHFLGCFPIGTPKR